MPTGLFPLPVRARLKALLAGGLVLGIGGSATLAAWTDEAAVEAVFQSSSFALEVSTDDGATWDDTADGKRAAQFHLTQLIDDKIGPGDTAYAALKIRTTKESLPGTVKIGGGSVVPGSGILGSALKYQVIQTANCSPAGASPDAPGLVGPYPDVLGTPLKPFGVAGGTKDSPGVPVDLCFMFQLPPVMDKMYQDTTASVKWKIDAESSPTSS